MLLSQRVTSVYINLVRLSKTWLKFMKEVIEKAIDTKANTSL